VAARQQGQVVDLAALRAACAPLLRWYERFLSEGRVDIRELDGALAGVRALAPVGGRLGQAIAVLVNNAGRRSTEQVVAALELLRQMPALRAAPPSCRVEPPRRPLPPRLPGFD
jgi:NAD(P)-dependent dehydrogenase (short-subunit alcohol dehydrogenase family)